MKDLKANDVMTREVLAARADWPLDRLAEFLIENDISGAPVIDEDGRLIGVVSLTDLVRHDSLPEREPSVNGTHEYYQQELSRRFAEEELTTFRYEDGSLVTVRDIMTPLIYNVDPDMPIQRVAEIMYQGRIHRLFVTESGEVKGIISALDLLKVIRDQ